MPFDPESLFLAEFAGAIPEAPSGVTTSEAHAKVIEFVSEVVSGLVGSERPSGRVAAVRALDEELEALAGAVLHARAMLRRFAQAEGVVAWNRGCIEDTLDREPQYPEAFPAWPAAAGRAGSL